MVAESYSKSWCRSFTTTLFDALAAREFRDMVYAFIIDEVDYIRIGPHDAYQHKSSEKYRPYIVNFKLGKHTNPTPHFFDWDYIGTRFMHEIYESFYTRARFSVEHMYDLDALLSNGVFWNSAECMPLNFIRTLFVTLDFKINPEDHSYTTKERRTVSADRELHATKEDFERQINQLAAILQIKHTNSFILGISIHVHHAQSSEKYQEFLVPLVYDLKVRGFDLRLTFYLPRPFKAADFTSAYDKPRAEWDEQIRKKSVFISEHSFP